MERKKSQSRQDKITALKDIKLKEIKFYDKSLDDTECHTSKEGKKKIGSETSDKMNIKRI